MNHAHPIRSKARLVVVGIGATICVIGLMLISRQHAAILRLRAQIFTGQNKPALADAKAAWAEKEKTANAALARVEEKRKKIEDRATHRPKTSEQRAAEPAFRTLLARTREPEIGRRYETLFARLNLSPERAALLRELLMKREVDPPQMKDLINEDEKAELRRQQRERCEQDIAEFLTPVERTQYAAFKAEMPASSLIFELQNLLAGRVETLDRDQATKLKHLLLSDPTADGSPLRVEEANWPDMDRATYFVSDQAFEAAGRFLSPTQLGALADLRELQLAQLALNQRIAQIYQN